MNVSLRTFANRRVIVSLALASAIAIAMLLARFIISGRLHHGYLAGNLVLAWIPLMLAEFAGRKSLRWTTLLATGALWLLFFPNAPYIVTDLVHLRVRPPIPLWFDIVVLQLFIWIGLCLAFASLQRMQRIVAQALGSITSYAFSATALGLAGFGIYLGRFKRWNSWDLLVSPIDLATDIFGIVLHPWEHRAAIAFTVLFGAFLVSAYLTLLSLSTPGDAQTQSASANT
jgi:uncharacterized membrane protein